MGGRAFSHDSIFLPEGPAESQAGTLQQQPGQDLVPGQCPPLATEETETGLTLGLPDSNNQEGAPGSPALGEESSFLGRAEAAGAWEPDLRSLPETCSWDASRSLLFLSSGLWSRDVPDPPVPAPGPASAMEDKVPPVRPSRPKRHFSTAGTIESVNLDAIPLALTHLDNSAAKHRLAVKPRNQRVSKKHQRLRRSQWGSLETHNGHCAGEMPTWPGEVLKPSIREEQERQEEEHGRRGEAEGQGHEAEAAEEKRLEEQSFWRLDSQSEEMEEEDEEEEEEEKRRRSLLGDKRKQSLPEGGRGEEVEEQWLELEVQSCQEEERQKLEEQRRWEEEGQRLEEERRRRRDEERRRLEEEERRRLEEEERQRLEEEERQRLEEEERQRLEEEEQQRRRDEERQRLEEEERQRLEEEDRQRRRDEERQRLEEEERQRLEEERQRSLNEERQRLEEEERQRLEEEERQRQEEQRCQEEERRKLEEEERRRLEEGQHQELAAKMSLEVEAQQRLAEAVKRPQELKRQEPPAETPRRPEAEKQLREEEEEGGVEWRSEGRRQPLDYEDGKRLGTKGNPPQEGPGKKRRGDAAGSRNAGGQAKLEPPSGGESEQDPRSRGGRGGDGDRPRESAPPQPKGAGAQERYRGGEEEEMRWREVDERQSTPRPYTFQVSSGGRQILFPKVNLSPVAPPPPSGHEPPGPRPAAGAHPLPASLGIPHTAILVTGAQLCGPAVNLSQIKDRACRSLLGRSEERKSTFRGPPAQRAGDGKARDGPESARNEAALAEWASIRSKILKNADGAEAGRTPAAWGGPRGSITKTQLVTPKFSITPAWHKFSDPARPGGGADDTGREAQVEGSGPKPGPADGPAQPPGGPGRRTPPRPRPEPAGDADGCKFAKDLPSFLVPGLPPSPPRGPPPDGAGEAERPPPGTDDGASPFGIKLRRTNYSLRFHYDQQAEQKKKKRLSGGSGSSSPGASSGGTLTPPVPADGQTDTEAASPPPPARPPGGFRWPPPQRPALAPKPAHQTPPPSPLSRGSGTFWAGPPAPRAARPEPESGDQGPRSPRDRPGAREEGATGKASLFGPETVKKEKPGLQSHHSLDASGRMDEGYAAQPTWINLALEKQRGFREQQASREERRKQAREAKQAGRRPGQQAGAREELEDASEGSSVGSPHQPTAPEKRKSDETGVSRLQRRELLQKSNTLPTSVTVEISDSVPPAPLLKEVAKRFSTPDAAPVATEPAWLALAKRKAKAWSDCPQIIK
ncbi:capping protein inhibiting regulator of actin dynamics [Tachyglossus aculeatus]|uniref:capping protein inhibiting regulator of actin dynamics n=1 Tax=Tachyglossus aculeatus TaxID=9261 RepID=UPI0018F46334|nr:capping protein inhibiting regulator of actin dynamics [Tachyglossus aculeatus]